MGDTKQYSTVLDVLDFLFYFLNFGLWQRLSLLSSPHFGAYPKRARTEQLSSGWAIPEMLCAMHVCDAIALAAVIVLPVHEPCHFVCVYASFVWMISVSVCVSQNICFLYVLAHFHCPRHISMCNAWAQRTMKYVTAQARRAKNVAAALETPNTSSTHKYQNGEMGGNKIAVNFSSLHLYRYSGHRGVRTILYRSFFGVYLFVKQFILHKFVDSFL